MNIIDRVRAEYVTIRYDMWLEWHGVRRRARRAMRREMRINVLDAAAAEGMTRAIDNLGSIRALARESSPDHGRRVRWTVGGYAAVLTFGAVLHYSLLMGTAWLDGASAAAHGQTQTGRPFFAPWVHLELTSANDGMGMSLSGSLLVPLALSAVAFVVGARPWRLVTGQGHRSGSFGARA